MISLKWKRRLALLAAFIMLMIAWYLVPYQDTGYGDKEAYRAMGERCDACLEQNFPGLCSRDWQCNDTYRILAKMKCGDCQFFLNDPITITKPEQK